MYKYMLFYINENFTANPDAQLEEKNNYMN